jgi:hypothetical protein
VVESAEEILATKYVTGQYDGISQSGMTTPGEARTRFIDREKKSPNLT